MTATAPDTERLLELDADTRHAWSTYSDRLRDLTGGEYEQVESESWMELQTELQRLEHERDGLSTGAA
jgi:hypothetical protein